MAKVGQIQWMMFWIACVDSRFFIVWLFSLFLSNDDQYGEYMNKKYCNCEETKDEFGGCVPKDEDWIECIACGKKINQKTVETFYTTKIEFKTKELITNSERLSLEDSIYLQLKKTGVKAIEYKDVEYVDKRFKRKLTKESK